VSGRLLAFRTTESATIAREGLLPSWDHYKDQLSPLVPSYQQKKTSRERYQDSLQDLTHVEAIQLQLVWYKTLGAFRHISIYIMLYICGRTKADEKRRAKQAAIFMVNIL
jgi:hypothetical protein